MKNLLFFIIALLLALLIWCFMSLLHAQQQLTQCQQSDSTTTKQLKDCLATGGVCEQAEDPGPFRMAGPDASELVSKYTTDHWKAINDYSIGSARNMKDSRCVWFSLSRLKGFIAAIEQNSSTEMQPNTCCDVLGIRMYFIEYDTAIDGRFYDSSKKYTPNDIFDPNHLYVNKTSVLMIPTYRAGDGIDHDFNPLLPVSCGSIDTTGAMWRGPIMALMMNHGGIIPPPYPSINAFANMGGVILSYKNSGADFMVFGVDQPYTNGSPAVPNPYANVALPSPSATWIDK